MQRIDAIYKSLKNQSTEPSHTGAAIDLSSLAVVKGKKGKLGRGSHGVVKLAHYQPVDGGRPKKVAVKIVPVDDPDAQAALQVLAPSPPLLGARVPVHHMLTACVCPSTTCSPPSRHPTFRHRSAS